MAHDPYNAPVPVPASLAALFRDLGFELALTARRADGAEMSERDRRGVERLASAYALQHPTPEVTAADVDVLAELRQLRDVGAPASGAAPSAPPARATGTGGE